MGIRGNLRVVRDHQDGLTVLVEPGQQVQNACSDLLVQITGWLVGKQ